MTTIKLSGGCLGSESMMVRCDLSNASNPVEVNYMTDPQLGGSGEFQGTQYQCADVRHDRRELIALARRIAAEACECQTDENCTVEEI